jgi:hypothetical protein
MEDEKISWQEYEYPYIPKSKNWFVVLGIVVVTLAVTSIIFKNVLLALIILVGGFGIAMYAARPPKLTNFEVNDRGIKIGTRLYLYSSLDSFWITENRELLGRKLLVESGKKLVPLISIPISPDVNVRELRDFLAGYMSEEELNQPFSDVLSAFLGI